MELLRSLDGHKIKEYLKKNKLSDHVLEHFCMEVDLFHYNDYSLDVIAIVIDSGYHEMNPDYPKNLNTSYQFALDYYKKNVIRYKILNNLYIRGLLREIYILREC
jgi:hypothetical protein